VLFNSRSPQALAVAAFLLAAFPSIPFAYDSPAPGVALAVPGAFAGFPFSTPFPLFSEDPRASAYNPAASADRELPSFGASAEAIFPAGSGSGLGSSFALYGALPTAAGNAFAIVDGGSADRSLSGYAAASGGSALIGLSKAASDTLSFGASFGAAALSGDGSRSGLYGAFGAELEFPSFAAGGSSVCASLLAAGPSLDAWSEYDPVVAWTPLIAAVANIVDSRSFTFSASALAAAPEFSDLVLGVGAEFGIGRTLNFDLGWLFRLSETLDYLDGSGNGSYAPRLMPSIALRLDGSSFLRVASYGATLGAEYRPVSGEAASAGTSVVFSRGSRDIDGPSIEVGPLRKSAYSPLVDDSVILPLSIKDASALDAWEAVVYGESGDTVFRRSSNVNGRSEESAVARLFSLRRNVKSPQELSVPLDRSVRDGPYRVRVWARDERGNESRSEAIQYVVDGTPPSASVSVDGVGLFTPNGDGTRDSLSVKQSGSAEARWVGRFADSSGHTVREFAWTDGPPLDFTWDGADEAGGRVPDGSYSYVLAATDAAGNASSFSIPSIVVDAAPTPLSLSLTDAALSPDHDGSFESTRLLVSAPVSRGLVDWTIDLVADSGNVFRSWSGVSARLAVLPSEITFDGRSRGGDVIPDGSYRFRARLRYENGNEPTAVSDTLTVDTKKPDGRVRASLAVLSADRGERQTFYQDLSRNAVWRGVVYDENGKTVRVLPLSKAGESSIEWNLFDEEENPVPAGVYRYAAEGRSATGIVGRSQPASFRVESGGAAVSLIADRSLFSPTLPRSGVRFLPRLETRERVVSYTFTIAPVSGGVPVRQFSGLSLPPSSFLWDGLDESNKTVRDGDYRAELTLRYESGVEVSAAPLIIAADGTPPEAKLAVRDALFSPNGDGARDTLEIAQDAKGGQSWYAEIVDEKGNRVFAREYGPDLPASYAWDGKTSNGVLAPDGRYRYLLSGVDAAGNESRSESRFFRLDARVPSAVLSTDKFAFSPNGDGFADSVALRLVPSFSDGLSSVSVRIVDASGAEVKRFDPANGGEMKWDGTATSGGKVPDGSYRARAELVYEKGDRVVAETSPFVLDATPPSAAVDARPLPFSPDADGENDTLSLSLAAPDASPIAGWTLTILDPENYPFVSFSGNAIPDAPLVWDGFDPDGNLVEAAQDYSYLFVVRDQLGNTAKATGKIPVDIFVLRDGDRLKIRVSSIAFDPNASSLSVKDSALTERNSKVLDRIAAVLARFPSYRIRVEGHAVNLSGTEREERLELEPLSLARATAVMRALADRGISTDRLEAKGLGGREPIVPHGDKQNRWRNRRVEFILVR